MIYSIKASIQCDEIQWSNTLHLEGVGLIISLSPQVSFSIIYFSNLSTPIVASVIRVQPKERDHYHGRF